MTMVHYCTKESDGTVHVTNRVGPQVGHHHVHTQHDFEHWWDGVRASTKNEIIWLPAGRPCDCATTTDLTPAAPQA